MARARDARRPKGPLGTAAAPANDTAGEVANFLDRATYNLGLVDALELAMNVITGATATFDVLGPPPEPGAPDGVRVVYLVSVGALCGPVLEKIAQELLRATAEAGAAREVLLRDLAGLQGRAIN